MDRDKLKQPSITQQVTFLHTDDLEKTAVFYHKIIGLPLILDQGACHIYGIGKEAFLGFCTALSTQIGQGEKGGVILTLVTDEVDAWHSYLRAHDIEIEKPPTLNEKFNIYHIFVRDPNGYLVEFQTFMDEAWPQTTTIIDEAS